MPFKYRRFEIEFTILQKERGISFETACEKNRLYVVDDERTFSCDFLRFFGRRF